MRPNQWEWWITSGVALLVVLTGGVTLLVVFLLWRDGFRKGWRAAREQPPLCPRCKYNLTGLTQCRCPECGTEFRLDELWRTPVVGVKRDLGDDGTKGHRTHDNP